MGLAYRVARKADSGTLSTSITTMPCVPGLESMFRWTLETTGGLGSGEALPDPDAQVPVNVGLWPPLDSLGLALLG